MKRPPLPAAKPVLDGSTIALYAEGGPVHMAREFWVRIRDQWALPWTPISGSSLAVAAGVLGPAALRDFCAVLNVDLNEVVGYLACIVDKDLRIHREVRALFPVLQVAFATVNLSHIDERLAAIPLLSENVRVWRFRRATANHNRTLRARSAG